MAEDQRAEFGDLLRRHRLLAGLSQQALAERAGLSVDAIAALERGRRRRPRPFTVRVLADTLALDETARALLVTAGMATPDRDRRRDLAPVPGPLTESVGRQAELEAVTGLLRAGDARLVTLTGPGGVGKTHLALAVVESVAGEFADGVTWVSLSVLADQGAITQAVASAFDVRETPGEPLLASLVRHLAARDALLLLDNCEHLVAASALLVEQLLTRTAKLRILATSRERLRLAAAVAAGQPVLAARLLGTAAALRGHDARRPPVETADYERTVADCSSALGPTAYAGQFTVGETTPAAHLLVQLRAASPK